MKKLLITILLVLLSIPAFSFSIEADAYFGEASGFNAGLVFGSGKFTNSFGFIYDTHEYEKKENSHEEHVSYDYYGYPQYSYDDEPKKIQGTAKDAGVYYTLDFATDFVDFGKFKIGMDIGTQLAAVKESGILVSLIPTAKVTIGDFDILAGYRGTLYFKDMVDSYTTVPFRSSFAIGGKYKFKSRTNLLTLDYIDTSSDPFVIKHDKIY